MVEDTKIKATMNIIEKILPNYFQFRVWETEVQEDGSVSKLYTSKAQELFNEISKELEK